MHFPSTAFVVGCALWVSGCAHPSAHAPTGAAPWIASWGAAAQAGDPPLTLAAGGTIREVVRVTVGGARVRVRLSNAEGGEAIHVGSAHLALHGAGSSVVPGSDRALTFGGASDVVIPAHAIAISDPVALPVAPFADLAVSLYLPSPATVGTEHSVARRTTWIAAPGDFTGAATFEGAKTTEAWYLLAGVDVESVAGAASVAVLGDSLTDGWASTLDANRRWTDVLAERLAVRGAPARAVINEGIAGNCLTRDLLGRSGLARLERDVFDAPGVTHLVLQFGANDLGGDVDPPQTKPTTDELIAGLREVVARAHARGVKVLGGTVPPFEGAKFLSWSPAAEAARETVNRWIRTSGAYDGVIDFDGVLRDPAHPSRLAPALDSGDHAHPTDAGYKAMADAVDLSLLGGG